MIINITKENYETEVLGSDKLVLLDFGAPWCVPCKQVARVIDELSLERGDVRFAKTDIESDPEIAAKNGVVGIPVVILFKDGKAVDRLAGVKKKSAFITMIEKWL